VLVATLVACSGGGADESPADTTVGADATDLVSAEVGQDVVTDALEDLPSPDSGVPDIPPQDVPPVPLQGLGGSCVTLRTGQTWLTRVGADSFQFGDDPGGAERFFLQPSDLETYLIYDVDRGYLLDMEGALGRATDVSSDVTTGEDGYISAAEWVFGVHGNNPARYSLRNRRTDAWIGSEGMAPTAAAVALEPAEGCTPYPEMSLDAAGQVTRTTFDDGTLYGIADIHEHVMSNLSFGGGIYHGAAFHRLGVPHALPDCSVVHGEEGRKDFFGYVYDHLGYGGGDMLMLVDAFVTGEIPEPNHVTTGWPDFTEWPNARHRATHQTMYYRWIERAWLAGLRLMVQHATSDYVICGLMDGGGLQPKRYDCGDMTSVDRIIDETWAMQRYIDAQSGGEGKGWFRVVGSPAEAREVIAAGKLAVVIGIETSNPFQCYLTPRPGGPTCDAPWVEAQLDEYYDKGVRAVFPVHKYDNRFSPGDGSRGFLQLGNFLISGHWLNLTQECVTEDMPKGWDSGGVTFGGLLEPREEYLSPPPNDTSGFVDDPLGVAMQYFAEITAPPADGQWCQNATITPVGEALLDGLMARGMIIEIDHFPQWSYKRVYEILEANDYPGAGTHGRHWNGRLFETGGVANYHIGRCQDPDAPGATLNGLASRVALIESKGGYPGVSFGFDFNGFAGSPGPRFAEGACGKPQPNPMTYPFTSYAGDVEFSAPFLGNRAVDFDQEGMIHIGLLPELVQDARADAQDDAALEPLFRSAEAYIRMWEKAEARSVEIRAARDR